MTSTTDDGPLPNADPALAELLGGAGSQLVPLHLKLLAEQLKKALDEAYRPRDH